MRLRLIPRLGWIAACTLLGGCTLLQALIPLNEPANQQVIPGGISDARPYFGTMRLFDQSQPGDFMLATCGCGDWRVLLNKADGSRTQFPVRFYSEGEYVPTGRVTFYGRDGDSAALGTVDQDGGTVCGDVDFQAERRVFSADRGDAHSLEIKACVLCHIGDDPIWPQPPGHPTYVPGETDCFECHTVTIE